MIQAIRRETALRHNQSSDKESSKRAANASSVLLSGSYMLDCCDSGEEASCGRQGGTMVTEECQMLDGNDFNSVVQLSNLNQKSSDSGNDNALDKPKIIRTKEESKNRHQISKS